MKYELYERSNNDFSNPVAQVLKNRGIKDVEHYLNLSQKDILPYELLDNIFEAKDLFVQHFNMKNKIAILVDTDPDGYCSATMMYSYIKRMDVEYPVQYIMHTRAKAHGLSNDVILPDDIKLLIIPDAATNDAEQCQSLKEKGIDILILDHHLEEKSNPYALIVNNQMSEQYTNKDFCGAGVTYKFLQALDDEFWNDFADDYLDLCALANISDNMDMRSYETRYLTDKGLQQIKNNFMSALVKAQEYSIGDKVNINNVQFYLTPVLNGCIRIAPDDEKELMFKAFIEEYEVFEYKKRATKNKPAETIEENIYDRAARLAKNAKARQDKQREKALSTISDMIYNSFDKHKVIMLDVTDIVDKGITGVVAIKVADKFNRPCILLNKYVNEDGVEKYSGSARIKDNLPIKNFNKIVNDTGVFDFAQGHERAFGVGLQIDKFEEALLKLDKLLENIEYESIINVDFICDSYDISVGTIMELSKLEDLVCKGIEEPKLVIKDIYLTRDDIEIYGKNEDTISFMLNDIKFVQFKCKEGNPLYDWVQDAWNDDDKVAIDIIGIPSVNEFNGIKTPQMKIIDVDVTLKQTNDEDDIGW